MFHSSFAIGAFIAPLLCQEFNLKIKELYIDFGDRCRRRIVSVTDFIIMVSPLAM